MTKTKTLTAERLKELLNYNPLTGVFLWKVWRGPRAQAGQIAGSAWPNKSGKFYRRIMVDGRMYLAHRLAVLWMTGEMPLREVDHRDGDGLNNAWRNLRKATRAQNSANTPRHTDNRAGFKGVYQRGQRFVAMIRRDKRGRYLGTYDTPEEAHAAYAAAAQKHFGEFARVQ
jgi:hypothetical protein